MTVNDSLAQLPLVGVDHLGVVVADLAPIVSLFSHVPGAKVWPAEDYPDLGLEIQFIEVAAGVRLELLRPTTPDGRAAQLLEAGRGGLHHLAFTTPDLELALRTARAFGLTLSDEEGRPGAHGSTIAFLDSEGLSGLSVELVQPGVPGQPCSIQSAEPLRNG